MHCTVEERDSGSALGHLLSPIYSRLKLYVAFITYLSTDTHSNHRGGRLKDPST